MDESDVIIMSKKEFSDATIGGFDDLSVASEQTTFLMQEKESSSDLDSTLIFDHAPESFGDDCEASASFEMHRCRRLEKIESPLHQQNSSVEQCDLSYGTDIQRLHNDSPSRDVSTHLEVSTSNSSALTSMTVP